jgi:hypothetical protein
VIGFRANAYQSVQASARKSSCAMIVNCWLIAAPFS